MHLRRRHRRAQFEHGVGTIGDDAPGGAQPVELGRPEHPQATRASGIELQLDEEGADARLVTYSQALRFVRGLRPGRS